MKIFLIIIGSFLIVALQLTIFPGLVVWGVAPDLTAALVVALAIFKKEPRNDWLVLVPMLWLDILIGRPFGLMTLSAWLVFSLISWLAKFLFKRSEAISLIALAFLGNLSFQIIFYGLFKLAGVFGLIAGGVRWADIWPSVLAGTLYNSLMCLILWWLIKKSYPWWIKING